MAHFSIDRYEDGEDLAAEASAILPLLPAKAIRTYEGCKIDDEFRHFQGLTIMHLYGVVSAYGPMPAGVEVMLSSRAGPIEGLLEPCILASADPADSEAVTYIDNIRCGLDRWDQACFDEPTALLHAQRGGETVTMVQVTSLKTMLDHAMNRMTWNKDEERLENLRSAIDDSRLSALQP